MIEQKKFGTAVKAVPDESIFIESVKTQFLAPCVASHFS